MLYDYQIRENSYFSVYHEMIAHIKTIDIYYSRKNDPFTVSDSVELNKKFFLYCHYSLNLIEFLKKDFGINFIGENSIPHILIKAYRDMSYHNRYIPFSLVKLSKAGVFIGRKVLISSTFLEIISIIETFNKKDQKHFTKLLQLKGGFNKHFAIDLSDLIERNHSYIESKIQEADLKINLKKVLDGLIITPEEMGEIHLGVNSNADSVDFWAINSNIK